MHTTKPKRARKRRKKSSRRGESQVNLAGRERREREEQLASLRAMLDDNWDPTEHEDFE